jgi:hypothetical protein
MVLDIAAFMEKAQRGLMHPRRYAIGRGPYLPITYDGSVKRRLLGSAAEVYPRSDATSGRFVLYPAAHFRLVKALQNYFQRRRG